MYKSYIKFDTIRTMIYFLTNVNMDWNPLRIQDFFIFFIGVVAIILLPVLAVTYSKYKKSENIRDVTDLLL